MWNSTGFHWIQVDFSGIHCKILHLDKTGIQLESKFQSIPVQSESLADVKCFSSGRTIPVDSTGFHWNPLESSWNWWGTWKTSNTAYCNPTSPSVLHWTKMLVLDNLSSSSINSVQVASILSNNTNLGLFFYWPPMLSTQNKTYKTIHACTLLPYIH